MINPSAHSTARRNLAQRIERLLRHQEALQASALSSWQSAEILRAIEAMDEERFADGERVMMKVERRDLWEPPRQLGEDRLQ